MSADHPYRSLQQPTPQPLGPQPPCMCGVSDETKQAFAAVGGWWHSKECLEWHARKKALESEK